VASRLRRLARAASRDDAAVYGELLRGFTPLEAAGLLEPELVAGLPPPTARLEAEYRAPLRGDGVSRSLFAEMRTTLCHEMLAKVDRMTMATGLEARPPYLDDAVVEAALALPSRFKVGARRGKRILRAALAPLVPRELLRGRKQGFTVPVGEWVHGPWRAFVEERLQRLGERPFIRRGAPRAFLEQHLAGRERGAQLYGLLALEEWCRAFLEGRQP
jgi:asparagine synthase (glutamine-hydrolysing)